MGYSFDINKHLSSIKSNVPLLDGLFEAHQNHYPIRIKPYDIWLLIVQAFSNHVNVNSEKLRNFFVDFDGQKELKVTYLSNNIKKIDKKILEDFPIQISNQIEKFIGKELLETLTPNFTTTNNDLTIIAKLSIMGAFKKYFKYNKFVVKCGNPYIIIEGTAEDYKKIINKAEKLSIFKFDWYINRIIPLIQKIVDAKEGNIDLAHFKNIIINSERRYTTTHINGWILKFFAYITDSDLKLVQFVDDMISLNDLPSLAKQMLIVPFTINIGETGKQYLMKYKVGFIGCDQNEKGEVFPVQGWIVSPCTEKEKNSII